MPAVNLTSETLQPTYRLLVGIPGKSNAFAISQKLGLPGFIIEAAKERLDTEDVRFEDLVAGLEADRKRIERDREQAATRTRRRGRIQKAVMSSSSKS